MPLLIRLEIESDPVAIKCFDRTKLVGQLGLKLAIQRHLEFKNRLLLLTLNSQLHDRWYIVATRFQVRISNFRHHQLSLDLSVGPLKGAPRLLSSQ